MGRPSEVDADLARALRGGEGDPWRGLDRDAPIALLPVRLETRWFAGASADLLELRVRIFPDAIHVANPRVATGREREEVIAYWRDRTAHGEAAPSAMARWQRIIAAQGEARGRWLRDRLTPALAPDGALAFPPIATVDDPQRPVMRALPDRFVVIAADGTAEPLGVWGRSIPNDVPVLVGDDPREQWQLEFATAETMGLAVRLSVPRARAATLRHVVALGVRVADRDAGATLLAELLEDHAVDRGLALWSPGTATNHVAGEIAGSASGDVGVAPPPTSDGGRVIAALGLGLASFRYVVGAARDHDAVVRAMHVATWPATWGYFFEQIVGGTLSSDSIASGRALFVDHVRGDGPMLTLAVGRQPYGVLPVSALSRWRTDAGAVDPMGRALAALLPRWLASGRRAPQVQVSGDALPSLLAALARQERSVRWGVRSAASVEVATRLWTRLVWADLPEELQAQAVARARRPIEAELGSLGLALAADVTPFIFDDRAWPVVVELVGRGADPASAPGYLSALATANGKAVRNHAVAAAQPRTLLYLLLRHALLREIVRAGDLLAGTPSARQRDVDVRTAGTKTAWERLDQPVAGLGGRSAAQVIDAGERLPQLAALHAHRAALHALARAPAVELERAAASAIDLASHRLDAWITGLATRRLAAMRGRQATGVTVGGYGWVTAPPVPAAPARDGVLGTARSHGHVLAPSLDHARTAAVLRAGFAARPGGDLAIDLSSQRVRDARWVLDAVRGGRSLAETLGFFIERELTDGGELQRLRGLYPLLPGAASGDLNRGWLDGLAAYHAWRAQPPTGSLATVVERLFATVDAVADLLLAESVHQHVVGNPERAGAVLDAVAAGTRAPPEPAVVETPLGPTRTTYQVVWSIPDDGPGWPGDDARLRAVANPPVNAAIAAVLGDPRALVATVRRGERAQLVSIADLDLCALDVCALAAQDLERAPLRALFAAAVGGDDAAVEVVATAALDDALAVAVAVRDLLGSAIGWGEPADHSADEWTSAIAASRALAAQWVSDDSSSHARRIAAILGAPVQDLANARVALEAFMTRAEHIDPAVCCLRLSGAPATRRLTAPPSTASVAFAMASQRARLLADAARVRTPLAALELVMFAAPTPTVALALADHGCAIVCGPPPSSSVRGLRVDAWVMGPARAEVTAGVAFHHDAPRARAPQSILLAVPPDPTQPWSVAALVATVEETIDLTVARLARPHDVWGPLLPAMYFADSVDDATASTRLLIETAANLRVRDVP